MKKIVRVIGRQQSDMKILKSKEITRKKLFTLIVNSTRAVTQLNQLFQAKDTNHLRRRTSDEIRVHTTTQTINQQHVPFLISTKMAG